MQNPVIVIPAYNRPAALQRLLDSLLLADIPAQTKLIISIDKGGDPEVKIVADNMAWPFGEKRIIVQDKKLGLKDHILKCGDLSSEYGQIIMLEDDLFVSPAFYSFALAASGYYENETSLAGISLYNQHYHYITHFPFFPFSDASDVYFLQLPSSWGQLWTAAQWKGFRNWMEKEYEGSIYKISVPEKIRNWGPQSWKKLFALYMIDQNKFVAYSRVSYTTNFGEAGEHNSAASDHFQSPLQQQAKPLNFLPFNDSLAVYDAWLECLPQKLKRMNRFLREYDFESDLNGCKPLESIRTTFVLSCRESSNPLMLFGCRLKPMELNILYRTIGNDIVLSARNDLKDKFMQRLKRSVRWQNYFYIHASLKQLIYFIFTGLFRKMQRKNSDRS